MKKLTSVELFRIPSSNFYALIEGKDFISSGIFTVKKKYLSPGSSFGSKGFVFNESMSPRLKDPEEKSGAVYHYDLTFDELLEESLSEFSVLYRVQLSGFTRNGVLYALYIKGFLSLPSKIIEFLLKNMSSQEKLMTNGKSLFITKGEEVIAIVESCQSPRLDESEKELIMQLTNDEEEDNV